MGTGLSHRVAHNSSADPPRVIKPGRPEEQVACSGRGGPDGSSRFAASGARVLKSHVNGVDKGGIARHVLRGIVASEEEFLGILRVWPCRLPPDTDQQVDIRLARRSRMSSGIRQSANAEEAGGENTRLRTDRPARPGPPWASSRPFHLFDIEASDGHRGRFWSAGCLELPGGGKVLRMIDATDLYHAVCQLGLSLTYRMENRELVRVLLGEFAFGPIPEGSRVLKRFASASGISPALVLQRHLVAAFGVDHVFTPPHDGQATGHAKGALDDPATDPVLEAGGLP